jgi:tetratricopeptide (TPR) repeat protein
VGGLAVCVFLGFTVVGSFVTGVLADERVLPRVDTLESYLELWPESARIQAKLTEARITDPDRDLDALEASAKLACSLSEFNYQYRLLLATVDEAKQDRASALEALEAARRLAPNNTEVAWRQANFLLREGRFEAAQDLFKAACQNDSQLVPATLDALWHASGENPEVLESVSPADPESQLNLAGFLVLHSKGKDAASVFSRIPRNESAALANTPAFITSMVRLGEWDIARHLWAVVVGADPNQVPLVWNGGFENPLQKSLNQFDWQFERGAYTNIRIDSSGHASSRSLKIEFRGRDTTKLDREVTQQIVLRSPGRYRLECWVRTEQLDTPEGPRIVVSNQSSGEWIAASAPIGAGTADWRAVAFDFTAPADKSGSVLLTLSVKRKPRFSFDEPTRGTIWLDDFSVNSF